MERLREVKRCSNPNCPSPSRVYLNGKTTCDACHADLTISPIRLDDGSIELLKSMEAVRSEVKTLVLKRAHG